MPDFRSKPERSSQACRGTSWESDAAVGEKAVEDTLQQVSRYALAQQSYRIPSEDELQQMVIFL